MTGVILSSILVANIVFVNWFVGYFSRKGGEEVKGIDVGYLYVSQLEVPFNLAKIWCNVRVIKYRFKRYDSARTRIVIYRIVLQTVFHVYYDVKL